MKSQRGLAENLNLQTDHRKGASELGTKWRMLQTETGGRPWSSLEETRQCVLCERTFNGRQVELDRDGQGGFQLRCPTPGCLSTPSQWVHPGNPLVSEEAWRDWLRLLDTLCEEQPSPKKRKPRLNGTRRIKLPGAKR